MLSESNANEPEQQGEQDVSSTARPEFRQELSKTERELLRRIDPGARALVIASVMLVLVLCWVLPWVDSASGWQVIMGKADPGLDVGLLPRLFAINSAVAGILLGALALATRRWALAWVAAMACVVVSFEGLVAIWSRQTAPQGGPAFGLILAVICMFVLAVQWLRIVWTRP